MYTIKKIIFLYENYIYLFFQKEFTKFIFLKITNINFLFYFHINEAIE